MLVASIDVSYEVDGDERVLAARRQFARGLLVGTPGMLAAAAELTPPEVDAETARYTLRLSEHLDYNTDSVPIARRTPDVEIRIGLSHPFPDNVTFTTGLRLPLLCGVQRWQLDHASSGARVVLVQLEVHSGMVLTTALLNVLSGFILSSQGGVNLTGRHVK